MNLPPDFDPAQARRIAGDLEDLQLKLHGGDFNGYRPGILVGAAVLRWLAERADGVSVVDSETSTLSGQQVIAMPSVPPRDPPPT